MEQGTIPTSSASKVQGSEILEEHSKEFNDPRVVKVTEGVYVAIGFALANSILLEGPDGIVIVDVTESFEAGAEVNKAFRKITNKPLKGIIYTHNHADHVTGAKAFIDGASDDLEIWSHYSLPQKLQTTESIGPVVIKRGMRQFGVYIQDQGHINSGIGLKLNIGKNEKNRIILPNKFLYDTEKDIEIADIKMRLIHIPGETPDQIGVWLPRQRAFICADDFYKAFPNLYAIRGTSNRNVFDWVKSLDHMRKLRPQFLVPCHTNPIEGEDLVHKMLTDYRDAIQFVHDQTVRFMNRGLYPEEILEQIKLPSYLETHPYLQQFYGTLDWSVRSVFDGYMGWFSGDPVDLQPLSLRRRAEEMRDLVGGIKELLTKASEAYQHEKYQWALELSAHVLQLDPQDVSASDIYQGALTAMAEKHVSANGRNYYLTCALEHKHGIDNKIEGMFRKNFIRSSTQMFPLFQKMSSLLKAELCESSTMLVVFQFKDTDEGVSLKLRNSILEVHPTGSEGWDVEVTTTTAVWRSVLMQEKSLLSLLGSAITGEFTVRGGMLKFKQFMDLFDVSPSSS